MDLLDSWDDDKDGQIRLREWLVHLKKFVNCKEVEVWYDVVREAVTDAFEEVTICAAHGLKTLLGFGCLWVLRDEAFSRLF